MLRVAQLRSGRGPGFGPALWDFGSHIPPSPHVFTSDSLVIYEHSRRSLQEKDQLFQIRF